MRRLLPLVAAGIAVALAAPVATAAAPSAAVRVDQLGFAPGETKIAYLLAGAARPDAQFTVVDGSGSVVLSGRAGASRGAWNKRYGAVQPLDLSALKAPGTYRIRVAGPPAATSPPFRIGSPADLFRGRVADVISFFQAQRDGEDVIAGPLHRRPAHLNDRTLTYYAWPRYENADSDTILGPTLTPLGGSKVDLEGGWLDAGDFVKFTHTVAYADVLLLASERAMGAVAPTTLDPEARFGMRFLRKAWNPHTGVLALQVGIGSGNKAGTFSGDHDLWRLPEHDDTLAGAKNRYLSTRPAFRANDPGMPVPPNLAGRVSAAFALAAQIDAKANAARAAGELDLAVRIFAAARVRNVRPVDVATALPHAFYPESSYRDDLELGAAELALAGQALGDPRSSGWLSTAESWARRFLAEEAGKETLNLYDTSALAHADLVRALRTAHTGTGLQARLLADLRAQLGRGLARSRADPFAAGAIYDDFDAVPHAFGLTATALLYRSLTGDTAYDAFATAQRGWALGANAWGESLMIGVGRDFPRCPQHVVANLSGRQDGKPPLLLGAVVNGPNDASLFSDGLGDFFANGHSCPPGGGDALAAFSGHGSRFVDDVRSWQTVEPAIDFDAAAALAFALSTMPP
jgi:endoglucanase